MRKNSLPVLVLLATAVGLVAAAPAGAANFTVTSTADTHDANLANPACATAAGVCTLRAAIDQANASASSDVITLRPGTYQLTGAGGNDDNSSGDLDVDDVGSASTTIRGAGARSTKLVGTGDDRVFELTDGSERVAMSGITVTGGGEVDQGGGIFADGRLDLTDSAVVGNRVSSLSGSNQGAGIFVSEQVNLRNVTISGNIATRGPSSSFGPQGGGLFDNGSPPSTLVNVTISGNQANGAGAQGGGIFYNADANTASYTNVSLVGNSVSGAGAQAGGIFVNDELTLKNTIVALNRIGAARSNCFLNDTLHSAGHNLEEGTDCAFTAEGDLRNRNPLLGPLANNGGSVDTRALLSGSPAIDAGTSTGCPATDARGITRPQGPSCDIGAFETAVPGSGPGGSNPADKGCLNVTGKLKGRSLGPAKLGRTRKAQRRKFKGLTLRSRKGLDRYCAAGGGTFRIGYPTRRLLRTVKRKLRRKVKGRVVIILTSSAHFSLKGLRAGDSTRKARRKLHGERKLKVGKNTWLVVPGRKISLLVSTRGGKVRAVGIGDGRLARGKKARKRFLRAWQIG